MLMPKFWTPVDLRVDASCLLVHANATKNIDGTRMDIILLDSFFDDLYALDIINILNRW